jgi:phytoene/squalene synthetase
MQNIELYNNLAYNTSERVTRAYSTSFSTAITLLDKPIRKHIYAIYGLVRLADEIVDSFRPEDMVSQLNDLELDVSHSINTGFSSNLLVHSFALTAKKYNFQPSEIEAFFNSMQTDVAAQTFSKLDYEKYIYGSAEVVGLMSLHVFCSSQSNFTKFSDPAKSLGAAFQKINFLRDMSADYNGLGRMYFPNINFERFDNVQKNLVIKDINKDIRIARKGLINLPHSSRYGVLLALYYYESLLKKMQKTPSQQLLSSRLRIGRAHKLWLYLLVRAQKISHS